MYGFFYMILTKKEMTTTMSVGQDTNSVDEIIAAGEGPTIEFKKSDIFSDPIHLAKEMVALGNTQGGRILIGVCDDGTIEGMKEKKGHELFVMNIARDRCDPPLSPLFQVYRKPNGDIYEIRISRYRSLPHAVRMDNGRVYFIRVGTTVREATPIELATLFEASREEVAKKPILELSLLDETRRAVKEITASPLYTITKKVNVPYPQPFVSALEALRGFSVPDIFQIKEPSPDLVPIRIRLSNAGQAPAKEIMISMEFSEAYELKDRYEVLGGLTIAGLGSKPTHGGLYRSSKNKSMAVAWLDDLGNDLVMDNFDEVYVKFPAEVKEYRIRASVVQNYYPPTEFQFTVKITPRFREITENVFEEPEKKLNE